MSTLVKVACPHCPDSSRLFSQHGLKVHIGRMHKELSSGVGRGLPDGNDVSDSTAQQRLYPQHCCLDDLGFMRKVTPVLKHIPKAARSLAAGELGGLLDRCVETNSSEDWCALLTFSYRAFKLPNKSGGGNLTQKVKENILSVDTSFSNVASCGGASRGVRTVTKIVESKVFEGDLRGAVRLLVSDDALADSSPETLASLRSKHPSPSRPLNFPEGPGASCPALVVKPEQVALALGSFHSGSAAGLDGIRPAHLKELLSASAGDNGQRLLETLTKFVNFMLSGQVNLEICPFLYGASLCALCKKDGGVRPIAVGSTFRRLAAKLACGAVRERMAEFLQPHQLGFGTRLGCEAAIHATRAFVMESENSNCVVVKLDIQNAFNSVERDVLLGVVQENIPTLYPFLFQVYRSSSNLYYDNNLILSQVGAQQGDPLGPLAFSLCIQRVIADLKSPLNVWYLDDGTIGGSPDQVKEDLSMLIPRFAKLGLTVSASKCEFFPCGPEALCSFPHFGALLPGLKILTTSSFNLLGSPVFPNAIPMALQERKTLFLAALAKLKELSSHVALTLLRMCFAAPKMMYFLRTAPTWLHASDVATFDEVLRTSIEELLNIRLNDIQWTQASLPIRFGGLGVRRIGDVGLPAFLGSVHGVVGLVSNLLSLNGGQVAIPFAADACDAWRTLFPDADFPSTPGVQRLWDEVGARRVQDLLVGGAADVDLARFRGVAKPESGAWLQALPSPSLGTLLDDDSLRVAVALRLGCDVCESHVCICGSSVEVNGHHALSCRRCSGRFPRHHALNDLIRRALISANVPCVLEPPGLSRTDGKRPDGLTLVPWSRGRCLIWDATCVSTFAPSHLARTSRVAASAAEAAAVGKRAKYAPLEGRYLFVPFAVETVGCWGVEAIEFIRGIGRRLRDRGLDSRSGSFLVQRLAIAIQRGNAASVMGSFAPGVTRGGLLD